MPPKITPSMLYDYVTCPHRLVKDLFEDPALRDPVSPFVQMLWESGNLHEADVVQDLEIPFLNLSTLTGDEREKRTSIAMEEQVELIYGGRISADNLLGDPDLLRFESAGYIAGDIKSGSGEDSSDNAKTTYAMQLGLYTDILERKGVLPSRSAFIWDIHGQEVSYDFDAQFGKRNPTTLWKQYELALAEVGNLVDRVSQNRPAFVSECTKCHWYTTCLSELEQDDDLTLIPRLGRKLRDVMSDDISNIQDLAEITPEHYIQGKKTKFPGISPTGLVKFNRRAMLIKQGEQAQPYLTTDIYLPETHLELFFDIEVDPMRDFCYLHGFVERTAGEESSEKFVYFFAEEITPDAEQAAFRQAYEYMTSNTSCSIYFYSKYERTIYRKLQSKYPSVCSSDDIENLFDPSSAIDLYFDVVVKSTEWPTRDHSIKTLATFLGFAWRDQHPSGAASIEWFDNWVNSGDESIKTRILEYNEDDCRATRVLLDKLKELKVKNFQD